MGQSASQPAQPAQAALDPSRSDEEVSGAYEVDPNWPKPMSTWPGHEGWTWGSTQGVFAQNPNRIFVLQRGELPELKSFNFPNLPKQVAVDITVMQSDESFGSRVASPPEISRD